MSKSTFNPYNHFGFLTNRVARLIIKSVEPSMEKDGHHFPVSCVGILADLWSKDGVNQKDLGISLVKTKSSINKMLTALEEEGLIVKKNDPNDGRGKLIFLTSKGKEMQYTIEEKGREMEAMLLSDCSEQEVKIAKEVLTKMYKKLYSTVNGQQP
ncbi:MAG: MarR family winged helix-turn-helix transcriptional regulator [Saprospiraceae bacterium]|nr:MarR family winged helix-turn-helix transcriptional regulator [Saprospiraceae bacterium]